MSEINFQRIDDNNWYIRCKLPDEIISYLWDCVYDAEKANIDHRGELAGNISRSLTMKDDKNVIIDKVFANFFNSDLKPFFIRHIEKHFFSIFPKRKVFAKGANPTLENFWVNYQKKYEFNPLHNHSGLFSFVIWMKIPYDWNDEKELPWVKGSNVNQTVGNFSFVGPTMQSHIVFMNKDVEGQMAIFPSHLHHEVHPFYTSDEERISISGNIYFEIEEQ